MINQINQEALVEVRSLLLVTVTDSQVVRLQAPSSTRNSWDVLATDENEPGYPQGDAAARKRDVAGVCAARRLVSLPGVQNQRQ
jgi:hypothetical protein